MRPGFAAFFFSSVFKKNTAAWVTSCHKSARIFFSFIKKKRGKGRKIDIIKQSYKKGKEKGGRKYMKNQKRKPKSYEFPCYFWPL